MNPEIVSFQYATGMCLLLENVGGCVHAGDGGASCMQDAPPSPNQQHQSTMMSSHNNIQYYIVRKKP